MLTRRVKQFSDEYSHLWRLLLPVIDNLRGQIPEGSRGSVRLSVYPKHGSKYRMSIERTDVKDAPKHEQEFWGIGKRFRGDHFIITKDFMKFEDEMDPIKETWQ